ncbi:MAG: hypothetical protein J3R72DRAFT_438693 [Linnemannia gamsii]|nr:MAG: hypothetical protein J3R72DRAFT_438693 [Linnemannia gamsii]
MVELSGGKYDQRTGRVTMRLASPILAKQFYTMLLSTRLVHELELSLDWNTSFEDLRILKGVMQQSNVFHLGLNLCGKTGPTSDFVYRNRRAEPIVQIMASGKMHTMSLKGTTSFLSQTKDPLKTATLHVRHLDLGENVASLDDFNKLEKLIRASPMLVRLGVMLGNIDQAFERLKPIVAGHKSLSILDLQLLDGTAALIHFEQGSNKVRAIGLKVVDPNRIRTTWVPFVTSVVLLAKNTVLRTSEHVHSFVKLHRSLKTFKIVQMPDGSRYELQTLCRDVDNYCGKLEEASAVAEEGASIAVVDEGHVDIPKGRPGFMKLHSIYKRTVLWNMALLIASVEETEAQKETATAPEDDNSMTRSIFVTRREDGSLVSVRFELEDEGSMVLHFDDFNASEVFQHTPATKLTVIGNDGFELLSELVKEPAATQFGNLRTLEFGSRRRDLLDILRHFQQAATHYPTLTQLNLWSVNNETMNGFTLPLRELDLSDHDVSIVQLPTLRHLLQSAFTLSRLTLSVPCFSEVFDIVTSAAQLNKQLSHVQLNKQLSHVQLNKQLSHVQLGEAASRLSAQFIVGTGEVHSISLRILESQVEKLRSLPKITELKILYGREVSRIQPLVLSIFTHYRQLKVFSMDYLPPDLLESIDAVHQAAIETSTSCQVIFTNVNPNSSFQPTVFELPLKSLVIPSTVIDEDKSFKIVQHLIGSSPSLQELELTVASVNVAQRIFDFIIEKRRPMPMLSLRLQEGPTAVFSLEPGKVGDGLMVAQQIAHADLSKTFPLSVTLERIDVVGGHLSISNVVGIALSVMRCRQEIQTFRFMDCPQQIKDIAIAIKDSFQREADSSTPERMQVQQIAFKSNSPTSTPFGLALICASHDDTQNGQSLDPTSKERVSLVLRKQQHGVLEAIGLDCSDPDGITLRLNPVAFNKSDIVLLSNVTNLTVSISSGSTLIEDFVRKPIRIFSHLKSLELSCDHSLQPRVLLTALEEAGHRPTLEQLHIWHPDNLSERLTYDLPIKTLDLTQCAIHPRDLRGLETIPASNLSLSRLTLNVPSLLAAFKFVRSNVGKLGSLTQLHLHGVDKTELTVLFKAGMGGMTSVTLTLKDLQRAISQETAPVLMMIQLSDPTLELICAIQDARLDNPDLQCLVLREGGADLEVKIEIPMRKIDLGESVLTQQQISSLKRLPAMCPQLMEFQMTVAPFPDLHEACRVLGPRFQALKTLSSFRLRLENGIVASIRFSKDGIIRSVALRIPEECVDERVKIPLVKQVSICPKRASRWLGAEHMKQELSKVLELYPEIETLELDGDVCGPLSVLLYLQEQAKTYGWRPLRYYRHRASETSEALITHNLPLRKLQLEEYVMSLSELSELETLLLDSPWISEAAITVASSAMIDSVDKRLKGCDQLEALTINSSDGYTMMLQWIGGTPASSYYYKPRLFKASDFQVSGTEWPLCFDRYRTPKLTILIDSMVSSTNEAPLSGTDANNTIHAILSKSHPGLVDLTHLALICPPHQFFGFLPKVLSFINITRIDLQDSFDSQTIISTVTGSGRVVGTTFSLDKISDHDLLDTFCSAFSESQLRAAMINVNANGHPHINVAFDLLDKEDEKQVSGQIQWDAYNVSSRRVFELLDTVRARSKAKTELEFRVIWRPSVRSFRTGAGNVLRPYSDIWDDAETMAKLVKLLVWRASHFDIEYETMKLLIPFVKAEAEINPLKRPQEEPFSLLRHYDIRVVDSAVVSEVIQEFNSLIRREVSHIIHDDSEIDVLSSHS